MSLLYHSIIQFPPMPTTSRSMPLAVLQHIFLLIFDLTPRPSSPRGVIPHFPCRQRAHSSELTPRHQADEGLVRAFPSHFTSSYGHRTSVTHVPLSVWHRQFYLASPALSGNCRLSASLSKSPPQSGFHQTPLLRSQNSLEPPGRQRY